VLLKDLLSSRYHLIRLMPNASLLRVPPDTPKAWRDIPLWRRAALRAAAAARLAGSWGGRWLVG
jgi:hypothetical protein